MVAVALAGTIVGASTAGKTADAVGRLLRCGARVHRRSRASKMNGRLVMANQLNVVMGILLAFLSNYLVAQAFDSAVAWRWIFGVEAVPAALFCSSSLLFRGGSLRRGGSMRRAVLIRLGHENFEEELREIVASLERDVAPPSEALFKREYAFPIFLALAVAMFNHLSGINALTPSA